MSNFGDIRRIQAGIHTYQGQREYRISQQGQMRWHQFNLPVQGAPYIPEYTPSDTGVLTTVAECNFAVVFTEPPAMDVSISLADGEEWSDTMTQPEVNACVVNWRRVKDRWMYMGADVSVTVRELPDELHFITHLMFSGPALATPVAYIEEYDNSNPTFDVP